MSTIKTAKEILREMEVSFNISDDKEYEYNIVDTTEDHVVNAMIVYAQQFLDLAAEQAENNRPLSLIGQKSILNIKQQIK